MRLFLGLFNMVNSDEFATFWQKCNKLCSKTFSLQHNPESVTNFRKNNRSLQHFSDNVTNYWFLFELDFSMLLYVI